MWSNGSNHRTVSVVYNYPYMSDTQSAYSKSYPIEFEGFGSCTVYHLRPGGHDPKHYHNGIEIEYVQKGSCLTHKQGRVYFRKAGEIHEAFNDSPEEVVIVCLTIPPESDKNTVYI